MMFRRNRRGFTRLATHHLLKFRILDRGAEEQISFAKDIGGGGVLFRSRENLKKGALLDLQVQFPSSPEPIRAIAKVVHSVPARAKGEYDVGAQFVEIDENARDMISDKVRTVHKKLEGGRTMKVFSILCMFVGIVSALAAIGLQLTKGLQTLYEPANLIAYAVIFLLLSVIITLNRD